MILYLGNNLFKKNNYSTSYDILSNSLKSEGYEIYNSSSKSNKLFRLIEMCIDVLIFRNKIKYVLIDTYSTNNFYYALLTSQICRLVKLKYLPILHGGNLPIRLNKNPFLSNLIFRNSYYNIAPSGYLKYEFKKYGYSTKLIPNTIPTNKYTYKKRNNLRPKLLYVRAFSKIYNPIMAIEVLKEIKKTYPKAIMCMVGPDKDGTLRIVRDLIDKYNLVTSIEITGVLSKNEWHMKSNNFDIFINTTNFDNTPISVIEAMALGLTIVSTNVGGLPYLINNGIDGILVNRNDSISMAYEICKIIKSSNNILAKNARKKAESFDWSYNKTKWKDILN